MKILSAAVIIAGRTFTVKLDSKLESNEIRVADMDALNMLTSDYSAIEKVVAEPIITRERASVTLKRAPKKRKHGGGSPKGVAKRGLPLSDQQIKIVQQAVRAGDPRLTRFEIAALSGRFPETGAAKTVHTVAQELNLAPWDISKLTRSALHSLGIRVRRLAPRGKPANARARMLVEA